MIENKNYHLMVLKYLKHNGFISKYISIPGNKIKAEKKAEEPIEISLKDIIIWNVKNGVKYEH